VEPFRYCLSGIDGVDWGVQSGRREHLNGLISTEDDVSDQNPWWYAQGWWLISLDLEVK
jgi:hypothetical protein